MILSMCEGWLWICDCSEQLLVDVFQLLVVASEFSDILVHFGYDLVAVKAGHMLYNRLYYTSCIKISQQQYSTTNTNSKWQTLQFTYPIMYQFAVQKDQQQSTTLTITTQQSTIIIKAARITSTGSTQTNNRLLIDFNIHENHEESSKWAALEHSLRVDFQDFVAVEMLPTSVLKVHVFILNCGSDIESAIFNGVWVNFLFHGVPLKRSVFHYEWTSAGRNKGVFDLHDPKTILSGLYNSPPPAEIDAICRQYKERVCEFLKREWVK